MIGRYKNGGYAEFPDLIRHVQCRKLRIRSDKPSVVNVDGEAVYTDDAQIELIPKAMRFSIRAVCTTIAGARKNSQNRHKIAGNPS